MKTLPLQPIEVYTLTNAATLLVARQSDVDALGPAVISSVTQPAEPGRDGLLVTNCDATEICYLMAGHAREAGTVTTTNYDLKVSPGESKLFNMWVGEGAVQAISDGAACTIRFTQVVVGYSSSGS